MIGILTQNNSVAESIAEILKDCPIEMAKPDKEYEAYMVILPCDQVPEKARILSIGCHISGEAGHIEIPITPQGLIQKVHQFCHQELGQNTFENEVFVFQKEKRLIINKHTGEEWTLTEKESELLGVLSKSYPKAMSREELLQKVWNYKPDLETHTLESHIYALRQKIGKEADKLFQSTETGYKMISD